MDGRELRTRTHRSIILFSSDCSPYVTFIAMHLPLAHVSSSYPYDVYVSAYVHTSIKYIGTHVENRVSVDGVRIRVDSIPNRFHGPSSRTNYYQPVHFRPAELFVNKAFVEKFSISSKTEDVFQTIIVTLLLERITIGNCKEQG